MMKINWKALNEHDENELKETKQTWWQWNERQ